MERKERKGRQQSPRRLRLNEIRRRARKGGEGRGRGRKDATTISLAKARQPAAMRGPSGPPGRNMQAEKPPSVTGLVHPAPQGGEDRRPHKPRRN